MAKIKNSPVTTLDPNTMEPVVEVKESLASKLAVIVGIDVSDETAEQVKALFAKAPSKKIYKKWEMVGDKFAAKTPLQMQQCVLCIADKGPVDMKQWVELLQAYEGFKTNQPVERIIAFYKTRMINEGLIAVVE